MTDAFLSTCLIHLIINSRSGTGSHGPVKVSNCVVSIVPDYTPAYVVPNVFSKFTCSSVLHCQDPLAYLPRYRVLGDEKECRRSLPDTIRTLCDTDPSMCTVRWYTIQQIEHLRTLNSKHQPNITLGQVHLCVHNFAQAKKTNTGFHCKNR